jgi:sodium/potassium-transporting ATPase subunit beta
MVQEEEYRFDDANNQGGKKNGGGIGKLLWNSETREFCGRDGASWGKVSLFYAIFYACLGSFFVGMLAVFVSFMPRDKPTYYGESSTMSSRGLNPGLGFRPQIDVEDHVIYFNPKIAKDPKAGYIKYAKNLENFLNAKYGSPSEDSNQIKCENNRTYDDVKNGVKSCEFNYETLFKNTTCTKEKHFGYDTNTPCVLVKLNKIISWVPEPEDGLHGVKILCEGESSADKDNIKNVTYYTEDGTNSHSAVIDNKYFPYFAQKSYRAPFIFVSFGVPPNTLVNIECKGYAKNMDNKDRMNRRGQTKFSLYIAT